MKTIIFWMIYIYTSCIYIEILFDIAIAFTISYEDNKRLLSN